MQKGFEMGNGPYSHLVSYDFKIAESDWDFVRENLAPIIGTYRYSYNQALTMCYEVYESEGVIPTIEECYEQVVNCIYASGWADAPRDERSVSNAVKRAHGAFYRYVMLGAEMPCMMCKHWKYQHVRLRASYDAREKALLLLDGAVVLHVDGLDPQSCAEGFAEITIDTGCGVEPPRGWVKLQLWLSSEEVIGRFGNLALIDEKLPEMNGRLYEQLVEERENYQSVRVGPWIDAKLRNRYARVLADAADEFNSNERAA
jgi:hypothetical protein